MKQAGFFDVEERLKRVGDLGDRIKPPGCLPISDRVSGTGGLIFRAI